MVGGTVRLNALFPEGDFKRTNYKHINPQQKTRQSKKTQNKII